MDVNTLATHVPWWAKIATKMILARLPIDYKAWKRMHLFEQGAMEQPAYAYGVFKKHFDQARSRRSLDGFIGLELGPGDSLLSAMAAYAFGASEYYLIDVGPFAQADVQQYRGMAALLADQGLPTLDAPHLKSVDTILAACRATYNTAGLSSLRAIPDKSVDFVWSHAVLQQIRRSEFSETMREIRRILRPGGISSHWVDLQDYLGSALDSLRFRESVWESRLMAESGFYTNRIRYSEMLGVFRQAGFESDVVHMKRWDRLPTSRAKLWDRFRALPEEELCVRNFHVILRPVSAVDARSASKNISIGAMR